MIVYYVEREYKFADMQFNTMVGISNELNIAKMLTRQSIRVICGEDFTIPRQWMRGLDDTHILKVGDDNIYTIRKAEINKLIFP